jgi:hypothetical protein
MTGLEDRDAAAAAVAKAPRVTVEQIKSLVSSERFFVDETLTICVLTLKNGFKVTGERAAADPDNFNEELGRKIAKDKALAEIRPLAGFLLRDTLHKGERPPVMTCKVVLGSRSHAFAPAPLKDGRPPGRHTEQPYSYESRGKTVSGVSYPPDPTDPANVVLDGEHLSFHAVCPPPCDPNGAEENRIFGELSPNFQLTAHVRNKGVLERLNRGDSYYVHFVPADD